MSRDNYVTTNKNAASFGENAISNGESNLYFNHGKSYNSGNAWGQADGKDSIAYSTLNGNSFGYGAMSGGTNTYSNGDKAVSVSDMRASPSNKIM